MSTKPGVTTRALGVDRALRPAPSTVADLDDAVAVDRDVAA